MQVTRDVLPRCRTSARRDRMPTFGSWRLHGLSRCWRVRFEKGGRVRCCVQHVGGLPSRFARTRGVRCGRPTARSWIALHRYVPVRWRCDLLRRRLHRRFLCRRGRRMHRGQKVSTRIRLCAGHGERDANVPAVSRSGHALRCIREALRDRLLRSRYLDVRGAERSRLLPPMSAKSCVPNPRSSGSFPALLRE